MRVAKATMGWRGLWLGSLLALTVAVCKDDPPADTSSSTTAGGQGGCPTGPPEPLFTITVVTGDGEPLPADTAVLVRWSAADESFVLDDQSTWRTLDDGSNVVCDVDRQGPVPEDLEELRCELWTSGVTEIEVTAEGYVDLTETLTPEQREDCERPTPTEHELELTVDLDAGMR